MVDTEPSIVVQVLGTELARFGMYNRRLRLCMDVDHLMLHDLMLQDPQFAGALFDVLAMLTSDMESIKIFPAAGTHPSCGNWLLMEINAQHCWVARPFQPGIELECVCANDITRLLKHTTTTDTDGGGVTSSYDPLGDGAIVIHGHGSIEMMRLYASGAVVLFSDPRMAELQDFCRRFSPDVIAATFDTVKTALRNMCCKHTIRVGDGTRVSEGQWVFIRYDKGREAFPVEPGVTVVPPSKQHPFEERAAILVSMFPPLPKQLTTALVYNARADA